MNLEKLINTIQFANAQLRQSAVKAVNTHITLRNWLIGFYIISFEQNGEDRAKYGSRLLLLLAERIQIKGLTAPELSRCRQFYQTYSNFLGSVTQTFKHLLPESILGTLSQQSESEIVILGTLSQELQTIEKHNNEQYFTTMFSKIPYSHFVELIKIKEETKRKFYELMVIKNTLSVRELERQIASLTYERVGLSQNTELAFGELKNKIEPANPTDAIKSVYFFDFLNLPHHNIIEESELEEALINHLEKFILELGNGFCFEARQKRLLIDDDYCFVDLVFYHRILKCHILIDLKVDKFKHQHLSQLNSYVACYNDQIKLPDDNVTIGILLCTEKGTQMVEYALAGMEEKLFVSKYMLNLPSKEIFSKFIENELNQF